MLLAALGLIGCGSSASKNAAGEASSETSAPVQGSLNTHALARNLTGAVASKVKLDPTTEFLEYSNKEVDPLSLVTCSDSAAELSADGEVDLANVGKQTVAYTVALGGQTTSTEVAFTVRDTKPPVIQLSGSNPTIEQGAEFDPGAFVASVEDPIDGPLARADAAPAPAPEAADAQAGLARFYDEGWYFIDGAMDPNTPGTYSFLVQACDKHGNTATKELLCTVQEPAPAPEAAEQSEPVYTYIANTSTGKFHHPSCRDIKRMKEANKLEITATRQEMLDMGYSPCGHCNP